MAADFDIDFVAFQTLTAAEMDTMADNDRALRDWSAYGNGTFPISLIADGAVIAPKLDEDAVGHGFLEIGRHTLNSAADTITVTNLPARKYLMLLITLIPTGDMTVGMTFNGDTGNNYARRQSVNGGADTTSTSQANINIATDASNVDQQIANIINVASSEKLVSISRTTSGGSGASNAPARIENAAKWSNTSNQISSITLTNTNTGDLAAGSELRVFG